MIRLVVPTLKTSRFKETVLPPQVGPNSRLFSGLTAITGPVAAANSKTPRPKVEARNTPAVGLICKSETTTLGKCSASSVVHVTPPSTERRTPRSQPA